MIRQLYSHYAKALHGYVEQFCPDQASADDIVQETFIRAWRHLPQLSVGDRPVRPWLYRVARNLLIDANRAARARPMSASEQQAGEIGTDSGLDEVLDRQLVSVALQHLSPAHQSVLVETFYQGGTMATVARELGSGARSWPSSAPWCENWMSWRRRSHRSACQCSCSPIPKTGRCPWTPPAG